jgi:hypothetical protein
MQAGVVWFMSEYPIPGGITCWWRGVNSMRLSPCRYSP